MCQEQYDKFQHTLALHCAPTLMGIKAASMVSFPVSDAGERSAFTEFIHQYRKCFKCKGIRILELCRQKSHVLMLFYRPALLMSMLRRRKAQEILMNFDYPVGGTLNDLLVTLKMRIRECQGFPHEVGLFLGYPPADVDGFIRHGGQNFIYSGYWKVYKDEIAARKLFDCYNSCTEQVCRQLQEGYELQFLIA